MTSNLDRRRGATTRERQLLTPHPSSSTQYFNSSPSRSAKRINVLPNRQIAVPPLDGSWLKIGRSSISSDIALPANNRWASRVHASVRYLPAAASLSEAGVVEVKCHGHNGLTLHIGTELTFVKRDKVVTCDLAKLDAQLSIEITGSLVNINAPVTSQAIETPVPSSPPAMYCDEAESDAQSADESSRKYDVPPKQLLGLASPTSSPVRDSQHDLPMTAPSSPLGQRHSDNAREKRALVFTAKQGGQPSPRKIASASGKENVDPRSIRPTTPLRRSSRSRSPLPTVFEEDEASPAVETVASAAGEGAAPSIVQEAVTVAVETVEPVEHRTTTVAEPEHVKDEAAISPDTTLVTVDGSELTEDVVMNDDAPADAQPVQAENIVAAPGSPISEIPAFEQADDSVIDTAIEDMPMPDAGLTEPTELESAVEASNQAEEASSVEVTSAAVVQTDADAEEASIASAKVDDQAASPSSSPDAKLEVETEAPMVEPEVEEHDLDAGGREEFADAILTALASSTLSPTPLSYLVPFFPADTPLDEVESFLRSHPAAAEVKRSGKDACGQQLRSQWYYAAERDTDHDRSARLSLLAKPIRSTRKQHKQYYWRPIATAKRVDPTGLVERRAHKRRK